ncbi:hypothetical protein BV20DRAFT_625065 [Pilatotrama ljubarskyi]|nr:hypothetical protein BV20DRAFT_625065 [Pilatotrama ljubarskyi]
MRVDLDILEHVCDWCQHAPSLLSLSLVSHAVRTIVIKRLLRMRPIVLRGVRQVQAFHKLVFSDPERRLPSVRGLQIGCFEIPESLHEEILRYLLDILRGAGYLRVLQVQHPGLTVCFILSDSSVWLKEPLSSCLTHVVRANKEQRHTP